MDVEIAVEGPETRDIGQFPGTVRGQLGGGECGQATSPATDMAKSAGKAEPEGLKGLCVNCEERFDCGYPKSPGGVWHCAEYR